jgi:hypothetical protein
LLKHIFLLTCLFLTQPAFSECTFRNGEYISELKNPREIKLIEIEVPKSAKYARNLFKIVASESLNISPKLKKKFKAKITINYNFGKCTFNGSIRQNGDWKDHIKLTEGGILIRSLDVKLSEGNILSSVHFKLLLPEVRGGANEILLTLLLKKMDIISPETFSVKTLINGTESVMLFQENATKEQLERNLRRESAIFEGDEELMWSFKNFALGELRSLSLSRLTNPNWFLKGPSSQAITLKAFTKLQTSYEIAAQSLFRNELKGIFPNISNKKFEEFAFLLFAANADHALTPNNRKYYYDSILNEFEPIYYDGNPNFDILNNSIFWDFKRTNVINYFITNGIDHNFIKKIEDLIYSTELQQEFYDRANFLDTDIKTFYQNAIKEFSNNIKILSREIVQSKFKVNTSTPTTTSIEYINRMEDFKLKQLVFTSIEKIGDGYIGSLYDGNKIKLSLEEIKKILSRNNYKGERAVFLDNNKKTQPIKTKQNKTNLFAGEIITSSGIRMQYSEEDKTISFKQTNPKDWVMIVGADLTGWSIDLDGSWIADNINLEIGQRFNRQGITGCLTIYKSYVNQTSISVNNGGCEDSLNIISSKGNLKNLLIKYAYADALDMDFSNIDIDNAIIHNAGNDCYDVSGGTYLIENADFDQCGDKGVSIGEGSSFKVNNLNIRNAFIGVSSKDYSYVNLTSTNIRNVKICLEAKQKKQEFGGAFVSVKDFNCDGLIQIDKNSIFKE